MNIFNVFRKRSHPFLSMSRGYEVCVPSYLYFSILNFSLKLSPPKAQLLETCLSIFSPSITFHHLHLSH